MKLRAFITHSLLSVTLLAVTTLAACIFALPDRARAQPEPTLELVPPSGPCDATLEATGTGFEPSPGPAEVLVLYLIQPGTDDISMGSLNPASVDKEGALTAFVPLGPGGGCTAAALDAEAEQPSGHLVIAVNSRTFEEPNVRPGERIADIIAVAQYAYTTTTVHLPTEALDISPASGPCDATIQVTGSGFDPGADFLLQLGKPSTDSALGTLAAVRADASGGFSAQVTLGALGCEAAQLTAGPEPELLLYASHPVPPPGSVGIPPVFGKVQYTFTTSTVSDGHQVEALPPTGHGLRPSTRPFAGLAAIVAVASAGVALLALSYWMTRRQRRRVQ